MRAREFRSVCTVLVIPSLDRALVELEKGGDKRAARLLVQQAVDQLRGMFGPAAIETALSTAVGPGAPNLEPLPGAHEWITSSVDYKTRCGCGATPGTQEAGAPCSLWDESPPDPKPGNPGSRTGDP